MDEVEDPSRQGFNFSHKNPFLRYIFKHGDLDGDGQLDFKEAEHLAKINKEKASNSKEEEELWESLERDDDEDEEYDEAEYE